jgi:hypothetical protein
MPQNVPSEKHWPSETRGNSQLAADEIEPIVVNERICIPGVVVLARMVPVGAAAAGVNILIRTISAPHGYGSRVNLWGTFAPA